jgi:putative transcriptional regulator
LRSRLRVLRAERGWSQARLADELAVSRQTVNTIETGRYDPSLPLAFRIARVFGQPIEEIFFPDDAEGEGESPEPRGRSLPDVSADWA